MNAKDIQCLLTVLKRGNGTSYYTGEVDGIYGGLSWKAIRDFQNDFGGLSVTGEADEATEKAMRHAIAYGIPEREQTKTPEDESGTNLPTSANWWDEIEFFDPVEFKCKCKGKYCDGYPHEIQPLLVQICDRARRWSGHPIQVISGLRCDTHNRNEKGHERSQHMYGEAADVYFYGKTPTAALAWLQSQPDVRYAYIIPGSNNIHFDIQPVGR